MKVIFAGYSKNGTKTMKEAFTLLGYNNYDFQENYRYQKDRWLKIFNTGGTKEDFYEMYKNVDSCTDMPSFYFWDEILKAFPDAKVVFCMRSEDDWWRSYKKQMESRQSFKFRVMQILSPSLKRMLDFAWKMHVVIEGWQMVEPWFGFCDNPEHLLRKSYRMHNANVLQNAPKDQLLVFSLDQGWEPLCKFLNLPVPDAPFPHKNKNATLVKEFFKKDPLAVRINNEVKISCALIVVSIAGVGYSLHKYGLPRFGSICSIFNNM